MDHMLKAGERFIESHRSEGRWDPVTSSAYMQYDMHRLGLEAERGHAMSGTMPQLLKSQAKAEEEQQKYMEPYMKMYGYMQIAIAESNATLFRIAQQIDVIRWGLDWFFTMGGQQGGFQRTFIDDLQTDLDIVLKQKNVKLPAANAKFQGKQI
jgi:hypothetical protein